MIIRNRGLVIQLWALVLLFCSPSISAQESARYRGGTISWRPSVVYNDSFRQIEFSSRVSWKFSYAPCLRIGELIDDGQSWSCTAGCRELVGSTESHCEEFSEELDYSTGNNNFSRVFEADGPIEITFEQCCWVDGANTNISTPWRLATRLQLGIRSDTGKINSAPVVSSPLTKRVQLGSSASIKLNITDADNDEVRCTLGVQDADCDEVCGLPKGFQLDESNCVITCDSDVTGLFAVALLVEDFHDELEDITVGSASISSDQPLSTVPFQFMIDVQPCIDMKPLVRLTGADDAKLVVGEALRMKVVGETCKNQQRIDEFHLSAPQGALRSDIFINEEGQAEIEVSWQPTQQQQGAHVFCARATQTDGMTSYEECRNLTVLPDFRYCRSLYGTQYETFDGYRFNFTDSCRYQLASTSFQKGQGSFNISLRNRFDEESGRFVIETIFIDIADMKFELHNGGKVLIYDFPLQLPFRKQGIEVNRIGKYLTLSSNDDVMLRYDGEAVFMLRLDTKYRQKVEGLCGNFNEDKNDEMLLLGKNVVAQQDPFDFAQLYRLEDDFMCDPPRQAFSDSSSCDEQDSALAICSILTEEEGCFQECHLFIDPEPFFESCMNALCGGDSMIATREIQVGFYADACQLENVTICDWRERTGIEMECSENSHYSLCTTQMSHTCSSLNEVFNSTICAEGCECDQGFFLSDGTCVPLTSCGCYVRKSYRSIGFTFRTDDCAHECTCNGANMTTCTPAPPCDGNDICQAQENGLYECSPRRAPSATCKVIGDPHYKTFDGVFYDSMSTCAHVLVRSRKNSDLVSFTVVGINEEPRLNNVVSHVREVQIQVGNSTNITLSQGPIITFNGETINPGSSFNGIRFRRTSTFLVVTFDFGLVVRWDGVDRLRLNVQQSLRDNIEGLCGNYDGNPDNDYMTPEGELTDVAGFVNSWRVTGTDISGNLFPSPPVNATEICLDEGFAGEELQVCMDLMRTNQTDRTECRDREPNELHPCDDQPPEKLDQYRIDCSILVDPLGPFAACHSVFDPFFAFMNCIFDLCAYSGNDTAREVILSSYDFDCRQENITNSQFRINSNSGLVCGASSEYSECVSQCEPSCDDPDGSECRNVENIGDFCEEGCRCLDGFIRSAEGPECISREKCGCLIKGMYQEIGYTYRTNECAEECTCVGGDTVVCVEVQPCQIGLTCQPMKFGFEECAGNLRTQSTCTVTGGRYFTTFDGEAYDWLATCSYVMVQSSPITGVPDFTVEVDFERSSQHFSIISQIRVVFAGDNNTLVIDHSSTVIGNLVQRTTTPRYAVNRVGDHVVVNLSVGLTLIWNLNSSLQIVASEDLRGTLRGLCGDYDDILDIELIDTRSFVTQWRVDSNDIRCQNETTPVPINGCNISYAREQCSIITNVDGPLAPCHIALDTQTYYDRCVAVSCASNHSREAEDEVIIAYVRKCRDYNISVESWRVMSNRTLTCSPNSVYTPCFSTCQPSCDDPGRRRTCDQIASQHCIEGCECEQGYLRSQASCVQPRNCGCTSADGTYIMSNESRMNLMCNESCRCDGGVLQCISVSCFDDQYCGLRGNEHGCHWIDECEYENGRCSHSCETIDGEMVCTCPTGFQLDQDNKTCIKSDDRDSSLSTCSDVNMEAQREKTITEWMMILQRYLETFRTNSRDESFASICGTRWTQWLDRDDPGGAGDEERLELLQREFPHLLCSNPVAVEARLSDGRPATLSGNHVMISPSVGLECLNELQGAERCQDFEVRFLCLDTII